MASLNTEVGVPIFALSVLRVVGCYTSNIAICYLDVSLPCGKNTTVKPLINVLRLINVPSYDRTGYEHGPILWAPMAHGPNAPIGAHEPNGPHGLGPHGPMGPIGQHGAPCAQWACKTQLNHKFNPNSRILIRAPFSASYSTIWDDICGKFDGIATRSQ